MLYFWVIVLGINLIFLSTSDKTLRVFEPVYPDNLCIDMKTFCNAFPFHIVFDEEVRDGWGFTFIHLIDIFTWSNKEHVLD